MRMSGIAPIVCAAALLLGCAAAPAPSAPPPSRVIARAAAPPIVLEREVRHYVDEQGQYWDDRGRRLEHAPGRAKSTPP